MHKRTEANIISGTPVSDNGFELLHGITRTQRCTVGVHKGVLVAGMVVCMYYSLYIIQVKVILKAYSVQGTNVVQTLHKKVLIR